MRKALQLPRLGATPGRQRQRGSGMFGIEFGIIGLIFLVLIVYALFHVIGSNASTLAKALWTVGIIVFPLIGFIAWLIFGPRSAR